MVVLVVASLKIGVCTRDSNSCAEMLLFGLFRLRLLSLTEQSDEICPGCFDGHNPWPDGRTYPAEASEGPIHHECSAASCRGGRAWSRGSFGLSSGASFSSGTLGLVCSIGFAKPR